MPTVACEATDRDKHTTVSKFDTDSGPVGIDNRCSACISGYIQDFETPPVPTNRTIKGFGGSTTTGVMVGTIKWKVFDDEGNQHTFRIPHSYYVQGCGMRLFSPQHWIQSMPDNRKRQGAGCTTNHQGTLLYWEDKKRNMWVPLSKSTNVSTFHLAPGYTKYHTFCAEADLDDEEDYNDPMCHVAEITDDEDSDDDDRSITSDQEPPIIQPQRLENKSPQGRNEQLPNTPMTFDLDLSKHTLQEESEPTTIQDDEEDRQPSNVAAEFLKYHIKFGHCSPKKIQVMARQGLLPKRLATCDIPICSACQYGKATKRPWRQKTVTQPRNRTPANGPRGSGQR